MLSRERVLESLLDLSGRVAHSRPELLGRVLRCALQLLDAAGTTALVPHGRQLQHFALRRGMAHPDELECPGSTGELSRLLVLHGRAVLSDDAMNDPRISPSERCPGIEPGAALFVPMRVRRNDPGYLGAFRRTGAAPFTATDVHLMTLLGAWAAAALENQKLAASVEKLAVTDDLTRVYNYRFLKTALRREIKRAARFRQDLSIIMIDVDNLKGYNDRHGHLRGSYLLREMAGLLAGAVRSWDLVAKYGGDEFTIILPQTGREGALTAAERLRQAIAEHAFPLAARGAITISLGIACFPHQGDNVTTLLQASDRALYRAKQLGRNRVEEAERAAA
jgi:diguanylate cyclase (GGDEF)-like protein